MIHQNESDKAEHCGRHIERFGAASRLESEEGPGKIDVSRMTPGSIVRHQSAVCILAFHCYDGKRPWNAHRL